MYQMSVTSITVMLYISNSIHPSAHQSWIYVISYAMHPIHVDTFDLSLIVYIRNVVASPNMFDRCWRILYTESHSWFVNYKLFAMNDHLNSFRIRYILVTYYHTANSSILYTLRYLLVQSYDSTVLFFSTCMFLTLYHQTLDPFTATLLQVCHSQLCIAIHCN